MSLNQVENKTDKLAEQSRRGEVVKTKEGKWIARLDEKGFLVLPEGLGRMMSLALKMERVRKDDWNPERIVVGICRKFNCHKLTFFLLSTVLGNDDSKLVWQKAKKAVYDDGLGLFWEMDATKGIRAETLVELEEKIKDKLKTKSKKSDLALLQIWREGFDKKSHLLFHSCLVGLDTADRLVCLEKQSFDYGRFQCVSLEEVARRYMDSELSSLKGTIWGVEFIDNLTIDIAKMEMVLMRNFKRLNDMHCKNILHHSLKIIKEDDGDFTVNDLMHLLMMEGEKWARDTRIILRYLLDKGMIKGDELISEVLARVEQFDLSDIQ